jgi:hypothetical protein
MNRFWKPMQKAHRIRLNPTPDQEAAFNVEMEGLALLAGNGSLGVTPVEPTANTWGMGPWQAVAVKQVLDSAHCCAPER